MTSVNLSLWVWPLLPLIASLICFTLIRFAPEKTGRPAHYTTRLGVGKLMLVFFGSTLAIIGGVGAILLSFSDQLLTALASSGFLGLVATKAGDLPVGFSLGDEAFVGLMAIIAGVPVSIAGSAVAIYLAYSSLRLSNAQNNLQKQANRIEDPDFLSARSARDGLFRLDLLLGVALAQVRLNQMLGKSGGAGAVTVRTELSELMLDPDIEAVFQEVLKHQNKEDFESRHSEGWRRLRQTLANCLTYLGSADDTTLRPEFFYWVKRLREIYHEGIERLKVARSEGISGERISKRLRYFLKSAESLPDFSPSAELAAFVRSTVEEQGFLAEVLSATDKEQRAKMVAKLVSFLDRSMPEHQGGAPAPQNAMKEHDTDWPVPHEAQFDTSAIKHPAFIITAFAGDETPGELIDSALDQFSGERGWHSENADLDRLAAATDVAVTNPLPVIRLSTEYDFKRFVNNKVFNKLSRAIVVVDNFKPWHDEFNAEVSRHVWGMPGRARNRELHDFVDTFLDRNSEESVGDYKPPRDRLEHNIAWIFVGYHEMSSDTGASEFDVDKYVESLYAAVVREADRTNSRLLVV